MMSLIGSSDQGKLPGVLSLGCLRCSRPSRRNSRAIERGPVRLPQAGPRPSRFLAGQLKKKGFLLIELLVTIAILSGGLVLILAGFNSSLNALRTSQNLVRASQILEERMRELEQQAKEEEGIVAGRDEGEVDGFSWVQEVLPLEETALPQDETLWDEEIAPVLETALSEVKLSLQWQEGKKERELSLITYLKSKLEGEWEKTEE